MELKIAILNSEIGCACMITKTKKIYMYNSSAYEKLVGVPGSLTKIDINSVSSDGFLWESVLPSEVGDE